MECEGGAIRALGSLFKLTEVYIWDDGSTETREVFMYPQSPSKISHDLDDHSSNIPTSTIDFIEGQEDVELTKQMDALGLPLSFQSNKEARKKMNKSKWQGVHLKLSHGNKEAKDEALEFTKVSDAEIVSPTVLHHSTSNSLSCMSMLGQSESYYYDVAVDISDSQCPAGEDPGSSTKIISAAVVVGTSPDLLNNDQDCEFVTLSAIMLNNEVKKGLNSSNLDAAPSPICCLTDVSVDHDKKELNGSLMECVFHEDSAAAQRHEKSRNFCCDGTTEQAVISETLSLSPNSEVLGHDGADSHGYNDDLEDWKVYWDSFYMRNFFHNIKTGTSSWDPPTGMEHLAFADNADGLNDVIPELTENDGSSNSYALLNYSESLGEPSNDAKLVEQPSDQVSMGIGITADISLPGMIIQNKNKSFDLQNELHGISTSCDDEVTSGISLYAREHSGSLISVVTEEVIEDDSRRIEIADLPPDKLHTQFGPGLTKQKKKVRRMRSRRKLSNASEELQYQFIFEKLSANVSKYWCQRYLLFSRFDHGIKMDEEGWFSVTPEPIARHHALRCVGDTIIDCFTGVGGNAIQFAQRCRHVTAIDVDPKKIDYAYHNAAIYGVDEQIDFIKGDFFILAPKLKADTVFLSPPWGGPDYAKVKSYNIMTMLKPHDGYFLFKTAKRIAQRIVMFLPRNVDLNQLAELSLSADHPWSLEVEKNFLNGKLKAITAYFSDTSGRQ